MDCLLCTSKNCKVSGKDCPGTREETLDLYREGEVRETYAGADRLVSGGRAGTLSRVDEILEYSKIRGYKNIGIAYCFSMEKEAETFRALLKKAGFKTYSYRCTINGLKEGEMCPGLPGGVNCNPLGQADAINREPAELINEMGLCLGHDILFHGHLQKPFTVLAVKDRVYGHNPLKALSAGKKDG